MVRSRLAGLALALTAAFVLSACGGTESAAPEEFESPAQREWESQVGPNWEQYEVGFVAGYTDACKAVRKAVAAEYDEAYADETLVDCADPPPSGYGGAPLEVPADPRAAGYADGVAEGCYVPPEVEGPVQPEC